MEGDEQSGGVSRRRRQSWRVGSPTGRGHGERFPLSAMPAWLLVLQEGREDASVDLLANLASLVCGVRVKLGFSAPEQACATSAPLSMPAVQGLGIRRSGANLNKACVFLSASQRARAVGSVLRCCDCKAGCCDGGGLFSQRSYSLTIQLENTHPGGGLLWF